MDTVDFAKVVAKALLIAIIYSVPAILAAYRRHRRAEEIARLNLLLGWTVLGWLVALAWALRRNQLSWRAGQVRTVAQGQQRTGAVE